MAETQIAGRNIGDGSINHLDLNFSTTPVMTPPSSLTAFVVWDSGTSLTKKVNFADLETYFNSKYSLLSHTQAWSTITDSSTVDAISLSKTVVTGGGTMSVSSTYEVKWTQRLILISNGKGTHFSNDGFFDVTCPPLSTVITGVGGATNKTVTAAGIPLAAWDVLYYILPIGSAAPTVNANFRVVNYTGVFVVPTTWIKVCARAESAYVEFANGVSLRPNSSIDSSLYDSLGSDIFGAVSSANTLATPRLINGVSFNGSANITVTAVASDVFAWAKASVKPSYIFSEIGTKPTTLVGYGITDSVPHQDGTRFTTSINSLLTSGFYNAEATPANGPVGASYFNTIVVKGIDTGLQIAGGYLNDNLWFRGWHTSGATFTTWRKVWHDGNFTNINQLTTRNFSDLQNKPTTLAGYGITETYLPLAGGNLSGGLKLLSGAAITYRQADNTTEASSNFRTGNWLHKYVNRVADGVTIRYGEQWWDGASYHSIAATPTGLNFGSTITAPSFIGAGTGLTGTATALNIGGTSENTNRVGNIISNRVMMKRRARIHTTDATSLNTSILQPEMGFTYGGSGEPGGPFIAFGGLNGDIDYSCQLVGSYSGGNLFTIRTYNGDTAAWNPWRTMLTDGNYNSYALPLTGGTLTGALTINATKLKIVDTLTLGLVSEVSGQLINYGTNFSQLGERDVTKAGGFFRIDTRVGAESEFFNVKFIPANGAEQTIFRLSTNGDVVANAFYGTSDMRLKDLVQFNHSAELIPTISYTWKDKLKGKKVQVGYSAQEVQKYLPEAVNEDKEGMLSVNYIQVLVAKVEVLEKRLKKIENGI